MIWSICGYSLIKTCVLQDSNTPLVTGTTMEASFSGKKLQALTKDYDYDGGFKIAYVKDAQGKGMDYIINQTMMRIDLPDPLKSGDKISFSISLVIPYQ